MTTPCRHFARGCCRYGDACRFSHDAPCPRPPAAPPPPRTGRARRRSRSRDKVRLFTEWLRDAFDLRRARVLDVAGGKGTLAFDVCNRTDAAEVCVIDPRRMRRGRARRRWRARLTRVAGAVGGETPTVREPKHLRVYFTRAVWEGDEASVRASYESARASRWCVTGLVADGRDATYETAARNADARVRVSREGVVAPTTTTPTTTREAHGPRSNESETETESDEEPDVSAEETRVALLDALARCTHVVALHPDQATDAAVDFAIERRLPFAVVPCCVYSKDFPRRRLLSGARVSTHADLVRHLVEKAGAVVDVRTAELPFAGKNIVVFSTGARRETCGACPSEME
jgi:hypothetical protein